MKNTNAYGLPSGSIRALLALLIFGGIWVWLVKNPETEVPPFLRDLMFIIMGHYFAVRKSHKDSLDEPAPLYLPRGTIRWLLLLGFLGTALALLNQHKLAFNAAGMTLLGAAGFLLGVLRAKLFKTQYRILEDIRATVSLAAGVLLLAITYKLIVLTDLHGVHALNQIRYEEILAGLVGFYFGAKS